MYKRYFASFTGIIIYALAINSLVASNIGVRSQDLFIETIGKVMHISQYAIVYFLFELVFLVLLLIFFKQLKMSRKELIISLFSILFLSVVIIITSKFTIISSTYFSFAVTMLILNFGLYLITQGNLIITPLDKFLVHVSIRYRTSYGKLRLLFDTSLIIIVELISLLVYGENVITLSLIACTLLSGPIIHVYESLFSVHTHKQT